MNQTVLHDFRHLHTKIIRKPARQSLEIKQTVVFRTNSHHAASHQDLRLIKPISIKFSIIIQKYYYNQYLHYEILVFLFLLETNQTILYRTNPHC